MVSEQQNSMDEMIHVMQTGRMSRRSFLERATALGFSSSVAAAFLAACGGSTTGSTGPVTLTRGTILTRQEVAILDSLVDIRKSSRLSRFSVRSFPSLI